MREGKVRSYLLYAAGEILLVIVGILIALQVNNWNEERLEQQQVRRYAHALINDLERDIEMVEPISRQMDLSLKCIEALESYTRDKTLEQLDNLDLYQLTTYVGYRPYEWHRSAFEQMSTAGALQQMRNFELANKITAYQALTRHLDQDYEGDQRAMDAAERLADEVVDTGYPNSPASEAFSSRMHRGDFVFPSPELHAIYAEVKRPLLADDIRQVRVMTNKFQGVGRLQPRVEQELPALVADAREIVALLRKEYPE